MTSRRENHRKQSLAELQSNRLPTANGLPQSNDEASFKFIFDQPAQPRASAIGDWKRNRDATVVPFNLSSSRSDT